MRNRLHDRLLTLPALAAALFAAAPALGAGGGAAPTPTPPPAAAPSGPAAPASASEQTAATAPPADAPNAAAAEAAEPAVPTAPAELRAYVRSLINKHLAAGDTRGTAYRYRLERETKRGIVEYRDCVESERILVTRLLAVNGKALTPDDRRADDARLRRIAGTTAAQDDSLREQQEEAGRIRHILEALPDAFVFADGGREVGPDGARVERIDFTADPAFRPPSREAMALQGMAGSLWVNLDQQRFYKVQGELVRSVSFGWGFLGKLKRGGKFMVEYAPMSSGRWMMTAMNIDFTASLFFGISTAHLLERRVYTQLQEARPHLSAPGAVEVLMSGPDSPDLRAASERREP